MRRSNARSERSARWVAPLWWSPATAAIFSSTDSGSMFQPLVVDREAVDAIPDPPPQEVVRILLRPRATLPEELVHDPVLPQVLKGATHVIVPRGILDELAAQHVLRPFMRAVVAEQERARLQVDEAPEHGQVLIEVKARRGHDGDQDLVSGEKQTGRVARVDASVPFVEDRKLVRGVSRGVEEPQDAPAHIEGVSIANRPQSFLGNRDHRSELGGHCSQGLRRACYELRGVDEMTVTPFVYVHGRVWHLSKEKTRPACVIEMDMRDDHMVDVPRSEPELLHRS